MLEPQPAPETKEARAAEAAAIRRRWINLGELVAVIAVLISAATLWLNWSDHRSSQAEKAAESSRTQAKAAALVLNGESSGKGTRLDLKPAAGDQIVQDQIVRFPSALGIDPVQTTGESRIEARWFDGPLKDARGKVGLPDDSRGDERMPVLIETRFLADGDTHRDSALYDVGYTIKGGFLAGHTLALRGLSLVRHVRGNGGQAALDARWKSVMPAKGK